MYLLLSITSPELTLQGLLAEWPSCLSFPFLWTYDNILTFAKKAPGRMGASSGHALNKALCTGLALIDSVFLRWACHLQVIYTDKPVNLSESHFFFLSEIKMTKI